MGLFVGPMGPQGHPWALGMAAWTLLGPYFPFCGMRFYCRSYEPEQEPELDSCSRIRTETIVVLARSQTAVQFIISRVRASCHGKASRHGGVLCYGKASCHGKALCHGKASRAPRGPGPRGAQGCQQVHWLVPRPATLEPSGMGSADFSWEIT